MATNLPKSVAPPSIPITAEPRRSTRKSYSRPGDDRRRRARPPRDAPIRNPGPGTRSGARRPFPSRGSIEPRRLDRREGAADKLERPLERRDGNIAIEPRRDYRFLVVGRSAARSRVRRPLASLCALTLAAASATAAADEGPTRRSYSAVGLGLDVVDYEESTARRVAAGSIDIETDSSLILTHDSRAFVSIDDDWGFYLAGNSSLGVPTSDESWEIDDTPVRTNRVAFERQRLTVLASRRARASGYWLFGLRYAKIEFSRFSGELTAEAADFGIDAGDFDLGTVTENVWDLAALAGYERTTLFVGRASGWRHQLRLVVGLPLITTVSNTEVEAGRAFRDGVNGYSAELGGAYGYQFGEHLLVAAGLELGLAHREVIDRESRDESGVTSFPANNLVYALPSVGIFWSF